MSQYFFYFLLISGLVSVSEIQAQIASPTTTSPTPSADTTTTTSTTSTTTTVPSPSSPSASSSPLRVTVTKIDVTGITSSIGTVELKDTPYGLLITPDLSNLTPGLHGFHVHQNPNCGVAEENGLKKAGMAAGDHLTTTSKQHMGPYMDGHTGDLPALFVDQNGRATQSVLAPRLNTQKVKNHSLMIHAGGDNYSDMPMPLGGGGERIACGVIQ